MEPFKNGKNPAQSAMLEVTSIITALHNVEGGQHAIEHAEAALDYVFKAATATQAIKERILYRLVHLQNEDEWCCRAELEAIYKLFVDNGFAEI